MDRTRRTPDEYRFAKLLNVEIGPAEGGSLAVATHDGYEPSHGILHHRHLFLARGGGNLRGADTLEYTGAPGEIPRPLLCFAVFASSPSG